MLLPFKNFGPQWMLVWMMIQVGNSMVFGQETRPTISVTGEAEINLVGDEIVIHASIESRARTPAEASKDNREKSRLLLEFLKSQSIAEELISAELLSIDPILPDSSGSGKASKGQIQSNNEDPFDGPEEGDRSLSPRRRAIGYKAFREFVIVVKDLKKFEQIYEGIVENGVNRVDSIRLRSSQESSSRERLRLVAVKVAKDRAQAMAKELGAELSAIKTISNSRVSLGSSSLGRGMRGMMDEDPFGSDTSSHSSSEGKITLSASVDVVFYLGNAEFKK